MERKGIEIFKKIKVKYKNLDTILIVHFFSLFYFLFKSLNDDCGRLKRKKNWIKLKW